MDEYPTGEPDGDSRLKISSWGTRIKTVGLAALDIMRCSNALLKREEGAVGYLR
jgi:hypothetical protein